MREIKFRGKRVDNGQWVYGGYCFWSDTPYIIQFDIWPGPPQAVAVYPETVGQYTGLNDKDGREIWEGDMLYDTWGADNLIVAFDARGQWRVGFLDGRSWGALSVYLDTDTQPRVIIGNIHDNPELLEA